MWSGEAPRSRSLGSLPQHDTGATSPRLKKARVSFTNVTTATYAANSEPGLLGNPTEWDGGDGLNAPPRVSLASDPFKPFLTDRALSSPPRQQMLTDAHRDDVKERTFARWPPGGSFDARGSLSVSNTSGGSPPLRTATAPRGVPSPTVDMGGVMNKLGRERSHEDEQSKVPEGRRSFVQHIIPSAHTSPTAAAQRGRSEPHFLLAPEVPAMPLFDGRIDFAQMNRDFDRKLADRNASSPGIPSPGRANKSGMSTETEMASSQVFVDFTMDQCREVPPLPGHEGPKPSLPTEEVLEVDSMQAVVALPEASHDHAKSADHSKGVQQFRVQVADEVAVAQRDFSALKQELVEAQQELTREEGSGTELEVRLAELRRQQDQVAQQIRSLRKAGLKTHLERRNHEIARMLRTCYMAELPLKDRLVLIFTIGAKLDVRGEGVSNITQPTCKRPSVLEADLSITGSGLLQQLHGKSDLSLGLPSGLALHLGCMAWRHAALNMMLQAARRRGDSAQVETLLVPSESLRDLVALLDEKFRHIKEFLQGLFEVRRCCKDVLLSLECDGDDDVLVCATSEVIRAPQVQPLTSQVPRGCEVDAARCTVEFRLSLASQLADWSQFSVNSTLGWVSREEATKVLGEVVSSGASIRQVLVQLSEAMRLGSPEQLPA